MNSSETPRSGWEAAELSTLREGLALSFRERLLWLEETLASVERICGAVSGRKLDRDGNILIVEPMVAEDPTPYGLPPVPPTSSEGRTI